MTWKITDVTNSYVFSDCVKLLKLIGKYFFNKVIVMVRVTPVPINVENQSFQTSLNLVFEQMKFG